MTERAEPPVSDAISAIRFLAQSGGIAVKRRAQRGIDRLGHDHDYVMDVLRGCDVSELELHERSDWSPDHFVYQFVIELEDEVPLYVKVSLNVVDMRSAELLSYKPDGSPE